MWRTYKLVLCFCLALLAHGSAAFGRRAVCGAEYSGDLATVTASMVSAYRSAGFVIESQKIENAGAKLVALFPRKNSRFLHSSTEDMRVTGSGSVHSCATLTAVKTPADGTTAERNAYLSEFEKALTKVTAQLTNLRTQIQGPQQTHPRSGSDAQTKAPVKTSP